MANTNSKRKKLHTTCGKIHPPYPDGNNVCDKIKDGKYIQPPAGGRGTRMVINPLPGSIHHQPGFSVCSQVAHGYVR